MPIKITKKNRIVLLSLTLLALSYLFRIKILMLLSIIEMNALSEKPNLSEKECLPEIAFHRGYSQDGKYPENSMTSLGQALSDKIKKIEIDVSIDGSNIFVAHNLETQNFPLESFTEQFKGKFDLVLIDVKKISSFNQTTLSKLKKIEEFFPRVIYLGRKCDLLKELADTGSAVSCEAFGLLGHSLMGWDYWSVDYRYLGEHYQKLLSRYPKKLILWTWHEASTINKLCELNPAIVLVDHH